MGNCPVTKGSENYDARGSAWNGMVLAAFICTTIAVMSSLALIATHLQRYRVPAQQRQIVRIIFSLVIYSLVAFGELFNYRIAQYIDPIGDLYESFGLW